jgi:hypothetical protein
MLLYVLLIVIIFLILLYIYLNNNDITNEKYTAVIIEPRKHKALEFVLKNFMENLSHNWDFIIFHGNLNKEYIIKILHSNSILKENISRIKLINLHVNNLTIKDYNNLLVSKDIYKHIPTETFLIFQTDSIICETNKDLINKFLKYDYTGAPWTNKTVGNGGLSLRKKSKMIEIIEGCPYANQPEDVYFSKACPEIFRNIPNFEDAKEFSVETVFNAKSFGVHKTWSHLKGNDYANKVNTCYGLDKLRELNR